jgi:hypothetical protein
MLTRLCMLARPGFPGRRRVLTMLALAGISLLAASCSAGSAPTRHPQAQHRPARHTASFRPPQWSRVKITPPIDLGPGEQLAGWNGGYLLAGGNPADVRSSADGRNWRAVTPPGLTALFSPSAQGRLTAGYGPAAYVVGWSGDELAVWRTVDGTRWRKIPLDISGLAYHDRLELDVSVIAGPRGVMVIGNDAVTPPSWPGMYVWRSADRGETFGQPVWVPLYSEALPGVEIDAAQPSPDGFVVSTTNGKGAVVLSSVDGLRWTRVSSAADIASVTVARPIAANASSVVVFNWSWASGHPLAMYSRGNAWHAAAVDPGRLPDAGVVPAGQRTVDAVCAWGTGFIAIGHVNTGPWFSGMVWYSADGSRWVRQPVRSNGFAAVTEFMDAAVSNGKVLLVADSAGSPHLLMWQAATALSTRHRSYRSQREAVLATKPRGLAAHAAFTERLRRRTRPACRRPHRRTCSRCR